MACERMLATGVRELPVTGGTGQLWGVVDEVSNVHASAGATARSSG